MIVEGDYQSNIYDSARNTIDCWDHHHHHHSQWQHSSLIYEECGRNSSSSSNIIFLSVFYQIKVKGILLLQENTLRNVVTTTILLYSIFRY